jgi:ADP-heptose:LPS heptosyltransferase
VPAEVEESVSRYLNNVGHRANGFRVVIHPAAGWETKQWRPERYAALADRILDQRRSMVFLLWGPGERARAKRVQESMRGSACLVPEWGLKAVIAFLQRCSLFVGGDSGPLHLASALGLPVLGLYGPSDPVRNGPPQGPYRVVRASSPCGPCYKRCCSDASCMESIRVEDAWAGFEDLCTGKGQDTLQERTGRMPVSA